MASVMMRILREELKSKAKSVSIDQLNEWKTILNSLKDRYFLIVDLVHKINQLFGLILLALVTSEFVRITNTSFHLLMEFYDNNLEAHIILMTIDFVKETVFFCILVYTPSRIRHEVESMQ